MNSWKTRRAAALLCFAWVGACTGTAPKHAAANGNDTDGALAGSGYSLGGVVWGLLPNTTVRLANGSDTVSVGNSTFVFPNRVAPGSAYVVAVAAQPSGQVCMVTGGVGTMGDSRVTQIDVQCTPGGLSVGGTVEGLASLSAVTLVNQGTSSMVSANGAFNLPTGFAAGTPYDVQVWADPQGAHCTVANGKGSVANANVSNVAVTCAAATAPVLQFATGQSAAVEIGQATMNVASATQLRSAATLYNADRFGRFPTKPCGWPGGPLFINDFWNFRVLMFSGMPASNFASADAVLGVSNFTDQGGMIYPMATHCAPNMFVVTNQQSYNSTFSYTGFPLPDPNTVVTTEKIDFDCDPQGTSAPTDVAIYGGKLLIADPGHNRIRTWNTVPSDPTVRQDPDLAFGQSSFTTCDAQTTASGFNYPIGFYLGAHHFMVADSGNHRVLIWNRPFNSVSNGAPADLVLGQADFVTGAAQAVSASSFDPSSVDSDETKVVVTDKINHRVLVWSAMPTRDNQPADVILGQPDTTSNLCNQSADSSANPRADTLCDPSGAKLVGPFLVVQDLGNLRVVIYRAQ